jgi:hypothetical protein
MFKLQAGFDALHVPYLAELGVTPLPYSPRQYRDYIAADIERWGAAIRSSGAKVD